MDEKVNNIHQASVYAAEAEKNHYALGQWRSKFDDWLAGDNTSGITQRTCQWIFGHILTQKQRAPYDVVDGWLAKGLPIDLELGTLVVGGLAKRTLELVGNTHAPRYLELGRYPEAGLVFVALSWLLGKTPQSYGTIAGTLAFTRWKEFDEIFLPHLKKRRNDEGMDYANFVLATISVICWRHLEANREMADGVYNDYFREKTFRDHKDEPGVVGHENGRTVGKIIETPVDGVVKVRGIGTPEMRVEVEAAEPEPQVETQRADVGLGPLPAEAMEEPVPHPLREDSLAHELEQVAVEALSKPTMHVHKEGRREAGVEPETHVTLNGNVEQQAELLSDAAALVPRPSTITIALDPEKDTETQLIEMINRFGTRPGIKKHHGPEALPILKPLPINQIHESIVKNITRKKRGWLTGKFCMLHMGHINFIHQAATLCDELVVVLSHSDKRFKDSRLSYRNKMLWLRTTFKNEPHITVVGIDESGIPEYPNGWQAWSDLVKAKIGTDFDYIFTSEPGDQSGYNTYFPGQEVRVVDAERKGVDISATRIREDMVKHWGMMPTVVRKDFVMRICIVGTESCGKTSLTKMLAKRYQTSWVEEYGRTYCEQDLCMDEDLLCYDDYGTIAARRYDMEEEAAASANRVMFIDTAALSTNYFCLLYEGREHPMVSAYQEREHYDAYIYLTDDVAFVEDGLRKNRNRDNTRFLFEKMLYANAKRHGTEIFKVSGNYNERLNKAIAIVDELLARPLTLV